MLNKLEKLLFVNVLIKASNESIFYSEAWYPVCLEDNILYGVKTTVEWSHAIELNKKLLKLQFGHLMSINCLHIIINQKVEKNVNPPYAAFGYIKVSAKFLFYSKIDNLIFLKDVAILSNLTFISILPSSRHLKHWINRFIVYFQKSFL